jgi:uncharacterized membrane protein
MNLTDGLLASEWVLATWVLFVAVLLHALRHAPWSRLADGVQQSVWLGTIVILILLWSLKAGVRPGLSLHLLGATVFSLAFGPWLSFIGLCLVLAGVSLNDGGSLQAYAANALIMAGVPVAVSMGVLRFSERMLPRQIFVYIFANAFFGAALAICASGLAASLLLAWTDVYPAEYLFSEYMPYVLLLGFSEAWLSGMVVTLFVVYRPEWIRSFDDARYLRD